MSGEELFWDLVEPLYADPAVTRSTMMGLPCARHEGRFFASLDRRSGALLVKLSADRVGETATRAALRDKAALTALDEAVQALLAAGAELSEPTRPRPPKGFGPADPAAARYAVRERLHVTRRFPVPAAVTSADLVDWCTERLQPFGAIHTWLARYTS